MATIHKINDPANAELRYGSLEVRLAATQEEVDAAQALRYRVFYEEMGALPTPEFSVLLLNAPGDSNTRS